jgi:hypothetical protein
VPDIATTQSRWNPAAEKLGAIARREQAALVAAFPEQDSKGGTLFLGQHYALRPRGLLMLGINPGSNADRKFSTGLYEENGLLPDAAATKLPYWRNARRLFGTTPELLGAMQEATYSFCCPFRSANWNGQAPNLRAAMIRHSQPIMTQMLADVGPRVVIIAGVAGEALFREIVGPELEVEAPHSRSDVSSGTYQWRARSARLGTSRFTIAQIPHLSRANSRKELERCGLWLSDVIRRSE